MPFTSTTVVVFLPNVYTHRLQKYGNPGPTQCENEAAICEGDRTKEIQVDVVQKANCQAYLNELFKTFSITGVLPMN